MENERHGGREIEIERDMRDNDSDKTPTAFII